MDYYSKIIKNINDSIGQNCFTKPNATEIDYLQSLNLPEEVLAFYTRYNPIGFIEVNAIRLLPILDIIEENTNRTPGYLLTPLGYCVVASTIEGDVYCIRYTLNDY